jgi:CHAT domain-containing protein/Flp pilus assembly protein TadD
MVQGVLAMMFSPTRCRVWFAAWCAGILCGAALAQSPAAEQAPWQRVLTGDDARRVAELEKKLNELDAAGQFTEAQAPAQEIMAIRSRVQGAGHWQTADAQRRLQTLKLMAALPDKAQAELVEVTKLDRQVFQLYRQGHYAEALPLLQQGLAIRQRHLGEEHPRVARASNDLAFFLDQSGKHAEAEPLHRKALAIRQKVLGEAHPDTATSYNNVASNLNAQGKYAEAEPLHRKALAIRQKVQGEDHPDTARGYNNVAGNLESQGKYAEAEPLFHKALAIRQKVLGEDHPDTAASYNNMASNLYAQGKYAAAEPVYRKALAIRQKVLGEDHPDIARGYNNLAGNLESQGKYAAAEPLYRKALAIWQKVQGEEHPDTARGYNNLASNLNAQGQYAAAEPLFRKALAIRQKALGEEHPDTARGYNNVASNLNAQGQYAAAESLFRQALAIHRKVLGEDHPDTATSYNNVAFNLKAQGKFAAAGTLFRKALAIRQKVLGEAHPDTATSYNNVASNLNAQGKYAEAEPLFRGALAISQKVLGEDHPDTASGYSSLAFNLHAQGKYREAEKLWRAAAHSFEAARLAISFSGLGRTSFGTYQSPLAPLATCLARTGQPAEAWHYWEANLARGLFDELAARQARPLSAKELRAEEEFASNVQQLDKQIAALVQAKELTIAQRQHLDKLHKQRDAILLGLTQFEAELARKHGPASGQVYQLSNIHTYIPADAALVGWLDVQGKPKAADPNGEHWACIVRQRGQPLWVKLSGSGPKAAWTTDDDQLAGQVRRRLVEQPGEASAPWRAAAGRLYTQRLVPLARHLGATADLPAVLQLIILPSPALAGVPIEALIAARTDQQPAYTISYAPSGTMFAWLHEQRSRGQKPRPPRLLALGDPTFRQADKRLPGTRREVEAIARLFDQPDTLLGSHASEQELDQRLATGRLREYTVLHLATHGVLDRRFAMQSALILAQKDLPDPLQQVLAGKKAYDGRLTAAQIMRTWKLDADLVTLSACQTGLGKYEGGEGYLGFAQALFAAGGRSLVLTLWKVDDSATTLLMTRFYQNLLGKRPGLDKPLPKAEALQEAKAWLRGLTAKEVGHALDQLPRGAEVERPTAPVTKAVHPYGHPYYWAAFILIGDPR